MSSKRRNRRSSAGNRGQRTTRSDQRARDEQALSRVRMGDDAAWRNLVESWLPFAFDRLTRRGTGAADAAGALTAAFTEVREHLDDGAPTGFAARVVRAISAPAGSTAPAITTPPPSDPKRAASRITRGTDAAALATDDDVAALLFETAAVLGAPTAEVLDLHWRGGLDATEIAAATGMEIGTVEDRLAKLPIGYAAALRTRLLWLDGKPAHDELAGQLRAAGVTSFDATASRLIHRHIRACATCRGRSLVALPAVDIFGAIPFTSMPDEVREQVLAVVAVPTSADEPETTAEPEAKEEPAPPETTAEPEAKEEPAPPETTAEPEAKEEPAPPETTAEPEQPEQTQAESTEDSPLAATPAEEPETPTISTPAIAPAAGVAALAATAPSTPAADTTPGPVHRPVSSRRARSDDEKSTKRWVGIGVAAALLLVAVVAFAATRDRDDDQTNLDVAAATEGSTTTTRRSTTTTLPTTSTPTTSTTAPAESTTTTLPTTTTTAGGFFPLPPPPETTTTLLRVTRANLNLTPKKVSSGDCATLSWEVSATGPVEVSVTGPGVSSSLLGGSAQACTGGTYSMTVTGGGAVLASRTQQLEIKP